MPEPNETVDPRAQLLEDVWKVPAARPYLEEALHIAKPTVEIPGRAARVILDSHLKKVEAIEQAAEAKWIERERKTAHEKAQKSLYDQGFTKDDVAKIEKLMEDEGIGLHANAALVYQARTQVAAPRSVAVNGMTPNAYKRGAWAQWFGPSGDKTGDGIMDGDFHTPGKEWLDSRVSQILTDFAAGDGKKWLDDNYWPSMAHPTKG